MLSKDANAATYLVDRHLAEGRGAKIAYHEAETGRSLTYQQMADGAALNAGALAQAAGQAAQGALTACGSGPRGSGRGPRWRSPTRAA